MSFALDFKTYRPLPYCPGCGHLIIARSTAKACEKLGWDPKDVVLVTDIGCVGLADKLFPCHTIHGLHGRSVALGMGIKFGTKNPEKNVIVYIGDGGATIGLQHLMEAARLNVDINVIVHNNMLFGMTGGQSSGLTPRGYKTTTEAKGSVTESYDIPKLVHEAGAAYSSRILVKGDVSDDLAEAFSSTGFSLVEGIEYCFSYGRKYNPDKNLEDLLESMGRETGTWVNKEASPFTPETRETKPLLEKLPTIEKKYDHSLRKEMPILLGGSAGEGVQTAATVLARAGLLAGIEVSKKGEFPHTVGTGFSNVEVIFSPEQIRFTGISQPEVVIISSQDGLEKNKGITENMETGTLVIDKSLPIPSTNAKVLTGSFREAAGGIGAATCAISHWLDYSKIIPKEALIESAEMSKHPESIKQSIKDAEEIK